MKTRLHREEKGIAFVLAIFLLLVVTVIGLSAVNTTTFDNMIAGNKRASDQAFYAAEAGINEFLGRFQPGADPVHRVTDNHLNSPTWEFLLAKTGGQGATKIGYVDADDASIPRQTEPSVQSTLDYGVVVKHKVSGSPPAVVFIGDSPVYIAKSYGYTADGGHKVIEVEFRRGPSYDPPAALYTEAQTDIRGSSTYISGMDHCGNNHKPGILTTRSQNDIDTMGNPSIMGQPPIVYNTPNTRSIEDMINYLKGSANYSYTYDNNVTLTGQRWADAPFSNYNTNSPLSYHGRMNIVYFNMTNKELKLAGQSYGAGILLIDGDLEVSGGFAWYGVVIVKGALKYTGGANKNITGGVMAGESVGIDVDVGGNSGIVYCSRATRDAGGNVPPYKLVRWKDDF